MLDRARVHLVGGKEAINRRQAKGSGLENAFSAGPSTTTCLLTFALEKRNDAALFLRKVRVTVIT